MSYAANTKPPSTGMSDTTAHNDYVGGYNPNNVNYNANHHHHANYDPDMENGGPSHIPKPHQSTVSQVYDPSFFKIANPGPLGLISFALTTMVLGLFQCGIGLPGANPLGTVGPDQAVFGLAVFFGGAAQFIAGVMEFRVGNTLGCTIHCSYGAFWLAFAMFLIPSLGIQAAYGGPTRAYTVAVGIFLMAWCFLTIIFFMAALRTNIAILAVLGFLALAFFLLSVAQFIATTHPVNAKRVNQAGGAIAVVDALCAFYAGSAGIMRPETTWIRFPVGEIASPKEKYHEKNHHQA